MVGILIKALVGIVLFVGALIGGLAATGRLNHDGTANIPVLNSFFAEPAAPVGEHDDAVEAGGHAAPAGETAAAVHSGDAGVADASDLEPPTRIARQGRSVIDPAQPAAADGTGANADGPGEAAGGDSEAGVPAARSNGQQDAQPQSPAGNLPDKDFQSVQRALQSQGKTGYEPGAFFRFDGMPAGLTPEELNEAWQRVEGVMQEVDRRGTALDLRQQELQELADDISRRWKELGEERLNIEQMQRQLDAKIQKFHETVTLVRNDEVAQLKRNAETLAAFERSKAAELVEQQWATERGQGEVLKLLEFMDKEAVNEVLAELPNAMVQDILKQRLRVSREAEPPASRK